MKTIFIILLFSMHVFGAGEIVWLSKILDVSKKISDKASDFRKSVKIAEDLNLIEKEQSKELRKQNKFLKDVDESDSVMDYIDNQIETDYDTIKTLDAIYDGSEMTQKYLGYSPYEELYIPFSDTTLKIINDALTDPKKSGEIGSQDAHNKLSAHQHAKSIIEQAKTNDLLAKDLAMKVEQQRVNNEASDAFEKKRITRSNDTRVFFGKFRRFMR